MKSLYRTMFDYRDIQNVYAITGKIITVFKTLKTKKNTSVLSILTEI